MHASAASANSHPVLKLEKGPTQPRTHVQSGSGFHCSEICKFTLWNPHLIMRTHILEARGLPRMRESGPPARTLGSHNQVLLMPFAERPYSPFLR